MEVIVLLVLIAICVGFYFKFRKGQEPGRITQHETRTVLKEQTFLDTDQFSDRDVSPPDETWASTESYLEKIRELLDSTGFIEITPSIFKAVMKLEENVKRIIFVVVHPDECPYLSVPIAQIGELDYWDIRSAASFDNSWQIRTAQNHRCMQRSLTDFEMSSTETLLDAAINFSYTGYSVEVEAHDVRTKRLPLIEELDSFFTTDRWEEVTNGKVSANELIEKIESLLNYMPMKEIWENFATVANNSILFNLASERFKGDSKDPWGIIYSWLDEYGKERSWRIHSSET